MAAKRSPILGYNHNVKYRGVVFHVQTEDSGLMNPHLFTHLFHEGVIVSTRKLVYDAGSNEESIKSLMQAQHKAVMKDLRKGTFDDKIDQYLGGTPGLEPRAGSPADATPIPRGTRAQTEESPPPDEVIAEAKAAMSMSSGSPLEIVNEDLSEPIELPLKSAPANLPPPPMDDAPTVHGSSAGDVAAAIAAANATAQAPEPAPAQARTKTAERTSKSQVRQATPPVGMPATGRGSAPMISRDSNPVIEITMEEDDISGRHRGPRDTNVEAIELTDGVPSARPGTDGPNTIPVRSQSRPASHGAAALPPMKSPSRPSITPPVITRPAAGERDDDLSAPVEIYQAAPPSVEPPPGERAERPGQYSVSRRDGQAPIREKTGRIAAINPNAIPAGLGRPRPPGGSDPIPVAQQAKDSSGRAGPPNIQREPTPTALPPPQGRTYTPGQPPPRTATPPPTPPPRPGAPPVPPRQNVHVTAPIANRTPSPAQPPTGSGVVMTRPAVIVGAPPKPPAQPTTQRVRKAREEEGRGFGQGLISEKSLDEVILAYLSEDAEEK